jgi:hypothetical protein
MAAGARAAANAPVTQAADADAARGRATGVQAARRAVTQLASGGVARGAHGFLRPFRRVGGILWLEVTGAFFLLFALVFSQTLWRIRASFIHGPDHQRFLIATAMTAVFLYLGISSFWRARKR